MEVIQSTQIPLSDIEVNRGQIPGLPGNPRFIRDEKYKKLVNSLQENPEMTALRELLVFEQSGKFVIIGGNMRYRAMKELGYKETICKIIPEGTPPEALKAYTIKDNAGFGEWDIDLLANEWDSEELDKWGVDNLAGAWEEETNADNADHADLGQMEDEEAAKALSETFIVPPFSILNTRSGEWQERKRRWRVLVNDKTESRENLLFKSPEVVAPALYGKTRTKRAALGNISFSNYLTNHATPEEIDAFEKEASNYTTTSLLDPVLSEVMLKWFAFEGAKCVDPFAGDTVFGFVAAHTGHKFTGIELRAEQCKINNERVEKFDECVYINDDGRNILKHIQPNTQDFLFSCPPYFDLERYSEDSRDASNQGSYSDFIDIIREALSGAVKTLKENRFAAIVVGDVRDKTTSYYYDFPGDIKKIMLEQGMRLYNEIILIDSIGSARMRASRNMEWRKVTKTHQNILVFKKGNIELENSRPDDNKRLAEMYHRILIFYNNNPRNITNNYTKLKKSNES